MSAVTETMIVKARAGWGGAPPDWVDELAKLADDRGLKGAEKLVGYSPSTLSAVINGSYNGDLDRVEQKVRGALMGVRVDCPVLGDIGRDRCLDHQAMPFSGASSMRTRLFRACRGGCPHSRLKP